MISVYGGRPCVGFVLARGRAGFEAFDATKHSGGNLTGFSTFESSVGGKWLALLKEAAPEVARVAMLFNPETAPFAEGYLRSAQAAAQTLGATVISAPCSSDADIQACRPSYLFPVRRPDAADRSRH
jgi:ABC-type uncharacterized transport system substrate-binding protein